jgi:hypothetical protein
MTQPTAQREALKRADDFVDAALCALARDPATEPASSAYPLALQRHFLDSSFALRKTLLANFIKIRNELNVSSTKPRTSSDWASTRRIRLPRRRRLSVRRHGAQGRPDRSQADGQPRRVRLLRHARLAGDRFGVLCDRRAHSDHRYAAGDDTADVIRRQEVALAGKGSTES